MTDDLENLLRTAAIRSSHRMKARAQAEGWVTSRQLRAAMGLSFTEFVIWFHQGLLPKPDGTLTGTSAPVWKLATANLRPAHTPDGGISFSTPGSSKVDFHLLP